MICRAIRSTHVCISLGGQASEKKESETNGEKCAILTKRVQHAALQKHFNETRGCSKWVVWGVSYDSVE